MIMFENQRYDRRQFQLILLLQADRAYWIRLQGEQIVDTFSEAIDAESYDNGSRCPWIPENENDEKLLVRLILDSTLDEIDRVAVSQTTSVTLNKWRRFRTLHHLRREYPNSTVFPLASRFAPHVGSVLHHVMPPLWDKWLNGTQSKGVLVTTVSNSIELMAQWSRNRSEPILLVLSNGADQRQVLVDKGSPAFVRYIDTAYAKEYGNVEDGVLGELSQTVGYLKSNVLSKELSPAIGSLKPVNQAKTDQWKYAFLLVDLLQGQEINLEEHVTTGSMHCGKSELSSKKEHRELAYWRLCQRAMPGWLMKPLRKLTGVGVLQWQVDQRSWYDLGALSKSSDYWRTCKRLNRLRYVSLMCVTVGIITVAVSSVNGMSSARVRNSEAREQSIMQQRFVSVEQKLLEGYSNPFVLSDSSRMFQEYKAANLVRIEQMLPAIALAITETPAIQLDQLVWSVVDDVALADSVLLTDAHLSDRNAYWSDTEQTEILFISLSGSVHGEDLLEQKQSMDRLVSQLLQHEAIESVKVLESPVDYALSHELSADKGSAFRINLLAGRL